MSRTTVGVVAGGRLYARVAQSYESGRQHLDVVGAVDLVAGNGRIGTVGRVAVAHRPLRYGRSEPPRGRVAR